VAVVQVANAAAQVHRKCFLESTLALLLVFFIVDQGPDVKVLQVEDTMVVGSDRSPLALLFSALFAHQVGSLVLVKKEHGVSANRIIDLTDLVEQQDRILFRVDVLDGAWDGVSENLRPQLLMLWLVKFVDSATHEG